MSDSVEMKRPPLSHTVKLEDKKTFEVKMSYGLFNDLQRVCPDPAILIEAGLSDPYARDYMTRRCFTDTKKTITDEADLIDHDQIAVEDPEEIEKLISWISGHLLYFFARSAENLQKLGKEFQAAMGTTPPAPSNDGSEASG